MGLVLEEVAPGQPEARIIRVDPKGNAAASGADLLVYDRITSVNGVACATAGFYIEIEMLVAAPGPNARFIHGRSFLP